LWHCQKERVSHIKVYYVKENNSNPHFCTSYRKNVKNVRVTDVHSYVHMFTALYVCSQLCTYVHSYVRMFKLCTYVHSYVLMFTAMYLCSQLCTYVQAMYVCSSYVRMFTAMYVCSQLCTYVHSYVRMFTAMYVLVMVEYEQSLNK
jgi:hypothetical protein